MPARREIKLVVIAVVVAAHTRHQRKLILDSIGILGVGARLVLGAVELVERRPLPRNPGRVVEQRLAHGRSMALQTHVERRTVGEIMGIHQIGRQRVFVAAVIVEPEIGVLVEVVEIDDESEVGTHLVGFLLIVDRRTDGGADLEIPVGSAVADVRTVERHGLALGLPVPVLGHRFAHGGRVLVAYHAAQTVFLHELPAPAHLRTVVGRVEPLVGHVDLVGLGQVAESVVVVVHLAHVGVHRTVEQHDGRKFLVARNGKSRR